MIVEVQLFGGLRAFAPSGRLTLEVAGVGAPRVRDLKLAAETRLASIDAGATGWVAASVVATDDRILRDDEILPLSAALALLPPVNGG